MTTNAEAEEAVESYFGAERHDAVALVPNGANVVLDVGCGTGANLALLRRMGKCSRTIGVESHSLAAARARSRVDMLIEGDVERIDLPLEPASIDVVLCLDVLEHLVDPWKQVVRLAALLRPGGALVASVPNVRNYKVTLPLLLRGAFEYANAGILDRTHLRFFTRRSARALFESAGLHIEAEGGSGIGPGGKRAALNRLTRGAFADLMITQFYFRSRKAS